MTRTDGICAVVLAAGHGNRLRPMTDEIPKALCPVGNVALLDRAFARLRDLGFVDPSDIAVNAWHHADQIVAHVGDRAHVSVETGPSPYGTAGGLRALLPWINGRDVVVSNTDAYMRDGQIAPLLEGWDRTSVRILVIPAGERPKEFGDDKFAGYSLLPWRRLAALAAEQTDLVAAIWRAAEADGELETIQYGGTYLDSGTPRDYIAANLDAARIEGVDGNLVAPSARVSGSITTSVIGGDAVVEGDIESCVVLPGSVVPTGEHLVDAVRYGQAGTLSAQL